MNTTRVDLDSNWGIGRKAAFVVQASHEQRPVILTFVRHYLPGYKSGGPVRTIANLVEALGDEFEFRIVTSDRDSLDSDRYPEVSINEWVRVGRAWVRYVDPRDQRLGYWKRLLNETSYHVLYLNSVLAPTFTTLPLLAHRLLRRSGKTPVIVAPRGEFSPGALALKRAKKWLFLNAAKGVGLHRGVLWQASTSEEADMIRANVGSSARLAIARNLTQVPGLGPERPEHAGGAPLRIIFISRISRMKNLDFAIRVLTRSRVRVEFDIWGPTEDLAYWRECQALMQSLPASVRAVYRGVARPEDVSTIVAGYDLLFLPTLGENYGHVIAEALAVGTPVLVSDRTPWRGLENSGVGWDLALEGGEAGFLEAIEKADRKVRREGGRWAAHVVEFASSRLADPAILADNRALFTAAISGGATGHVAEGSAK